MRILPWFRECCLRSDIVERFVVRANELAKKNWRENNEARSRLDSADADRERTWGSSFARNVPRSLGLIDRTTDQDWFNVFLVLGLGHYTRRDSNPQPMVPKTTGRFLTICLKSLSGKELREENRLSKDAATFHILRCLIAFFNGFSTILYQAGGI
jgi:hypothetical protein